MAQNPKRIVLLGSTGSIGRQVLDVIDSHQGSFEIVALAAGSNWELLAGQIERFEPGVAALASETAAQSLKGAVNAPGVKLFGGQSEVDKLAALPDADLVVNAIVGFNGLGATLTALSAGKRLALANKESLVAGGELAMRIAEENGSEIVPIDSEHSALSQCLRAGVYGEIKRLILTASGGPFLFRPLDEFDSITPQEALKHPNWNMGRKISVDSATMMNKALEIIEARWLFQVDPDRIDVAVHPQSVIHSMVEFQDSSVIAQLSMPDMRLPIRHALFYPDRVSGKEGGIDFSQVPDLTFSEPDAERYPALAIAYEALDRGGTAGAILNAANEIAVQAFLDGKIRFRAITDVVRRSVEQIKAKQSPGIDDIISSDRQARTYAAGLVGGLN